MPAHIFQQLILSYLYLILTYRLGWVVSCSLVLIQWKTELKLATLLRLLIRWKTELQLATLLTLRELENREKINKNK